MQHCPPIPGRDRHRSDADNLMVMFSYLYPIMI